MQQTTITYFYKIQARKKDTNIVLKFWLGLARLLHHHHHSLVSKILCRSSFTFQSNKIKNWKTFIGYLKLWEQNLQRTLTERRNIVTQAFRFIVPKRNNFLNFMKKHFTNSGNYFKKKTATMQKTLFHYPKPNSTNISLELWTNFFWKTQQMQYANKKTMHI